MADLTLVSGVKGPSQSCCSRGHGFWRSRGEEGLKISAALPVCFQIDALSFFFLAV